MIGVRTPPDTLPVREAVRLPQALGGRVGHLLDVGAGREGALAGAGDDDGPTAFVGVEPLQRVAELPHRLDVERVEHLGPIEGDKRDVVDRAVRPGRRKLDAEAMRGLGVACRSSSRASGSQQRLATVSAEDRVGREWAAAAEGTRSRMGDRMVVAGWAVDVLDARLGHRRRWSQARAEAARSRAPASPWKLSSPSRTSSEPAWSVSHSRACRMVRLQDRSRQKSSCTFVARTTSGSLASSSCAERVDGRVQLGARHDPVDPAPFERLLGARSAG